LTNVKKVDCNFGNLVLFSIVCKLDHYIFKTHILYVHYYLSYLALLNLPKLSKSYLHEFYTFFKLAKLVRAKFVCELSMLTVITCWILFSDHVLRLSSKIYSRPTFININWEFVLQTSLLNWKLKMLSDMTSSQNDYLHIKDT